MNTKTKKQLKHLHHLVTRQKFIKHRRTRERLFRSFFILIATLSTGGLAVATIATKPIVTIEVQTNFKPHSLTNDPIDTGPDQVGEASWYALGLPAPDTLTCASTKFPRGTYLQVKNLRNGLVVVCRVNDYGPEAWTHRAIDLSRGSARVIDIISSGTTQVEIRVVPPPPSAINWPLRVDFSRISGYSLCRQLHTTTFCEDNRQSDQKLR